MWYGSGLHESTGTEGKSADHYKLDAKEYCSEEDTNGAVVSLELVLAESLVSARRGVEINSLVRRLRRNSLDICAAAVEALLLLTGCWAGGRDEHALHDLVAELEVAGSIASSHARKALLTTVNVLLEELYEI